MATLPNSGARSSGGQSLNLAMAGLAALSLAFFTYAMPDDLFSSLIARSGLPGLVAAAEPPLGMKARGAVIAAVAVLVFALVLLLFRAIDRISARPARAAADSAEAEAPRLRRADAHPDAPSRRPLLAGRDLGDYVEPEDEDDYFDPPPAEEKFADLEVSALPGFLAGDEAEATEAEVEDVPVSYVPPAREDSDIDALVSQLPDLGETGGNESISELMQRLESGLSERELGAGPVQSEPVPEQRETIPQWLDASRQVEMDEAGSQPETAELEQAEADEPEAIDFTALRSSGRRISEFGEIEPAEAEPAGFAEPHSSELNLSQFAEFEPEAEAEEGEEPEDESVGLGYASLRTRTPLDLSQPFPQASEPSREEPVAEEAPPIVEPQVGHRLRGTINDLRRIAARG
jgi:hypothetical protein